MSQRPAEPQQRTPQSPFGRPPEAARAPLDIRPPALVHDMTPQGPPQPTQPAAPVANTPEYVDQTQGQKAKSLVKLMSDSKSIAEPDSGPRMRAHMSRRGQPSCTEYGSPRCAVA